MMAARTFLRCGPFVEAFAMRRALSANVRAFSTSFSLKAAREHQGDKGMLLRTKN